MKLGVGVDQVIERERCDERTGHERAVRDWCSSTRVLMCCFVAASRGWLALRAVRLAYDGGDSHCVFPEGESGESVKPLGRLVRLGYTAHTASTYRLSTCSSRTALLSAYTLGVLISRGASHLDAFSGYPFPTSLPGTAPGGTTGTRGVGPSRSSRTRDGSSQHSNAHDGYRPNCLTTF